jgi:hypothetical protein
VRKRAPFAWHKFAIGIVSAIGAAAYGAVIVSMVDRGLLEIPHFETALIGFVSGAFFWIIMGRILGFFGVFGHEFAHLVLGLLMLRKPEAFFATAQRGHVRVGGKNFLVDLAPYYFPTFSIVLLLIFPLLRESAHPYFYPILGFVTGYHLVSHISDFKFYQGDIRASGPVFSVVFCLFANTVAFGFVFAFVAGGYGGGWAFLKAGVRAAGVILSLGWEHMQGFLDYVREPGAANSAK